MSISMTSNKPYIVRAFYDWISDNQLTPYIQVDTSVYGVIVPPAYVQDGQIVLNISMSAVGSISLAGDAIMFSARFGGKLEHLTVPYGAIAAIYAKENGAGTALPIEHPEPVETNADNTEGSPSLASVTNNKQQQNSDTEQKQNKSEKTKPSLKVIK